MRYVPTTGIHAVLALTADAISLWPDTGHGALWVSVKDVDKLYAELEQRGARIEMAPTNMPWGSREMHVRDRDSNLLRFAGPTR